MSDKKPENPRLLTWEYEGDDCKDTVLLSDITLRDLFAAAALAGIAANPECVMRGVEPLEHQAAYAKAAFATADAMLRERERAR